jgi:protein tyrosine phosphatase (PTP) superfamily phosphohydrolase (DUF442 family)
MLIPYRLIWLPIVLILTLLVACSTSPPRESAQTLPPGPIHNLHQLSEGMYSGGEPPSSDHYAQLAELGIRTVVSVDAIAPNPELAEPYGIRIVHLPIGYDGIDEQRAIELAAAIETLEHPIYVHCHHGKHRGPAALCVGAIGAGLITNKQANDYMLLTGTSPKYTGLWEAARIAQPLDDPTLASVEELPSRAPVSSFVDAMGQLDRLHDRLWDMSEDDWKTPEDHPDLSPTAVSGQIHDLLRAMLDDEIVAQEGQSMRTMMVTSIDAAARVERDIDAGRFEDALGSMDALHQSCVDCHDRYR